MSTSLRESSSLWFWFYKHTKILEYKAERLSIEMGKKKYSQGLYDLIIFPGMDFGWILV